MSCTVRLTPSQSGENRAREEHDGNRSEAIRSLIDKGLQYDDRVAEFATENERLHRERRQLLEQREENQDLVRYVEEERAIQQRREARRDAPLWRRARWYVFGRSDDSAEA